jgi:hypothetical protein
MDIKNTFAGQFARIGQQLNKQAFEVRFNQVQRGLLEQMNNEKIKAVQANNVEREAAELQKKRDRLFERSDQLRGLIFDLKSTALRYLELRDTAQTKVNSLTENATLSQDDVDAVNATIDGLKNEIAKIKTITSIPGLSLTDANLANYLRQDLETLDGLTAVAGTLDADGSDSPTNDNRAVLDALASIAGRAQTYADSTTTLVAAANEILIDNESAAYGAETDLAQLTAVELSRQDEELADIETRYGNLIRAISLAFEVQSGLGDALSQGNQFEAPAGSVLNLFT